VHSFLPSDARVSFVNLALRPRVTYMWADYYVVSHSELHSPMTAIAEHCLSNTFEGTINFPPVFRKASFKCLCCLSSRSNRKSTFIFKFLGCFGCGLLLLRPCCDPPVLRKVACLCGHIGAQTVVHSPANRTVTNQMQSHIHGGIMVYRTTEILLL
jgi:hypothetical protein